MPPPDDRSPEPQAAWQKAATIGAPGIGSRYLTPLNPTTWDLIKAFLGGERPQTVAAQDPYGIKAWEAGKGPPPMLFGTTEPAKLSSLGGLRKATEEVLDVSHAARMKRAAEQGFDVERRLYHGTSSDFPKFAASRRQIYLTDRPEIADIYAMNDRGGLTPNAGPNVMAVYAKAKKPLVISDLGPEGGNGWSSDNLAAVLGVENPGTGTKLIEEARRQGYDLIEIRDMSDLGGRQSQFIPLTPSNVRSVNAAFDPRKVLSPNLLAGLGGGALLSSLARPQTPEAR